MPRSSPSDKQPWWCHITRERVLFVFGLAGIAVMLAMPDTYRPDFLLAFLAMVGLPAFLPQRKD